VSEKRKPRITFLLKIEAKGDKKSHRVELFDCELWGEERGWKGAPRFRMRVNGRWFPKGERRYFYKSEVRDILWRSLPWNDKPKL